MEVPARHAERRACRYLTEHRSQFQSALDAKTPSHNGGTRTHTPHAGASSNPVSNSRQRRGSDPSFPRCGLVSMVCWFWEEHMKDIVIISAVRTPIGKFQGALKSMSATQLGALVVKAAVERAGLPPALIAEVIMGSVVQAAFAQTAARQAAIPVSLSTDREWQNSQQV